MKRKIWLMPILNFSYDNGKYYIDDKEVSFCEAIFYMFMSIVVFIIYLFYLSLPIIFLSLAYVFRKKSQFILFLFLGILFVPISFFCGKDLSSSFFDNKLCIRCNKKKEQIINNASEMETTNIFNNIIV